MKNLWQRLGLILVLCGVLASAVAAPPLLPKVQPGQVATQLADGRWLLTGGKGAADELSRQVLLFDPVSGKLAVQPGLLMHERIGHTTTLMPDGRVLVLGGLDKTGVPVAEAEIYEPASTTSTLVGDLGLIPRAYHTATLLPDGNILIVGGVDARGSLQPQAELLSTADLQPAAFNAHADISRKQHTALLLPSDGVLFVGGRNADGKKVGQTEYFDVAHLSFLPGDASYLQQDAALYGPQPPTVFASTPYDGAANVDSEARIVLRFSRLMRYESLSESSVQLFCAEEAVPATVTPVERGVLLFVSPRQALKPGSDCSLTVVDASALNGMPLASVKLSFHVAPKAVSTPPAGGEGGVSGSVASMSNATSQSSSVAGALLTPPPAGAAQPGSAAVDESAIPPVEIAVSGAIQAPSGTKLRQFRSPLHFEPNNGQRDASVKFSVEGNGYRLNLAQNATRLDFVEYRYRDPSAAARTHVSAREHYARTAADRDGVSRNAARQLSTARGVARDNPWRATEVVEQVDATPRSLTLSLVGANSSANSIGMQPLPSKSHYVYAKQPSRNLTVPHYGKVLHTNVYAGIDKIDYGKDGSLEYDWLVKPGADPGQIGQEVVGADSVALDASGDAVFKVGSESLRQKKPLAWQTVGDKKISVDASYQLVGKTLRLQLGAYDKTLPLTIDPVVEFLTIFSEGPEWARFADLRVAHDDSVFISISGNYPSTQDIGTPGSGYLSLMKLKPGGTELEYITFFEDTTQNLIDLADSSAGPVPILYDGSSISRLKPAGDAYESTKAINFALVPDPALGFDYGGSFNRAPPPLTTDAAGALYFTKGWTSPTASPSTLLVTADASVEAGCSVTKLNPDLVSVAFRFLIQVSSCLVETIKIDTAGNLYAVVQSASDIPTTIADSGSSPYYLFKISATGGAVLYSRKIYTLPDVDIHQSSYSMQPIDVDSAGNVFLIFRRWIEKYDTSGGFGYSYHIPALRGSCASYQYYCDDYGPVNLVATPSGQATVLASFWDPLTDFGSLDRRSIAVLRLDGSGNALGEPLVIPGEERYDGVAVRLDSQQRAYVAGWVEAGQQPFSQSGDSLLLRVAFDPLLISTPNPSTLDQPVLLSLANLDAAAGDWATFYDGGALLGAAPVSGGSAALSLTGLTAGTHVFTASYAGTVYSTTHVVISGTRESNVVVAGPDTIIDGDDLTLQARVTAADTGAPVSGVVKLMEGPVVRGTSTLDGDGSASFNLVAPRKGIHRYAVAYLGNADVMPGTGYYGDVSVQEAPIVVVLTAPVEGATVAATGTTLVASALPGGRTRVSKVSFLANGSVVGEATSAPYTANWGGMPPGTYTLIARALSDTSTPYDSPPVVVTVGAATDAARITYFHQDLVGNAMAASDATGNIVYTEEYRPYGARLENAAASNVGQPAGNRIWFHGKVEDEDTGLQYFGARYYDPVIGRFMGADPAGVDPGNVHSFNRYAYGNNNPYRYRDPDGNSPLDLIFLAADVAKLGIAVYSGVGVSEAVIDVGLSLVGTVSPIPGTGELLKGVRIAEHVVEAAHGGKAFYEGSKLARNMLKDGNGVIKGVEEAHHIVAQGAKDAAPARKILEDLGIGIHDAVNGAAVAKSAHKGLHTKDYYKGLNEALAKANGSKDDVLKVLNKYKSHLEGM